MPIFIFCFFLTVFVSPRSTHADVSLSFGLYASDKPTVIVKQFRPIINYLESSLHEKLHEPVHIKIQVASSYEKGIRSLETGAVNFARFGPASYVEVKTRNQGVRIIAIESKKGSKRFNGIICVQKDSPIIQINDLKGKRFAFGDQLSTIGRYLSQQYLFENGIMAADLSSYDYLGRHDKVGYAVGIGQYDAGALKESTFEKLLKKGVPHTNVCKICGIGKSAM
ncbi:MAG: PhnD/SsuA/transferrin family substrate-binding protein, partial [Desulfobulbaceae bacterium]|nr:PhnD/SsuA/transferrin family substrate-binding protein [Candidatus Desulfobia pelagia]